MQLYSIVDADLKHLEEICADIKKQYDDGVANCALFYVKLVPEGDPAIDKASLFAERYIPFRDRLAEMGVACGILVQCTLGHGYALNQMFGFQRYHQLTDGQPQNIVCPYDERARLYFKEQMAKLAALHPTVLMVDDDFRLMFRAGKGCACPLHMRAFRKATERDISREELYDILSDRYHPQRTAYTEKYVETQRESIVEMARAIREGIDSVDPTIRGVICATGSGVEFYGEIASILAGEGNAPAVRINNGNYAPVGNLGFSNIAHRCATSSTYVRRQGIDTILAETDTCPHNRYSTSAYQLHSHFTVSILEGVSGAKHWITRLDKYEPNSGLAYRRILAKYAAFYSVLSDMAPRIRYEGVRIPIASLPDYGLTHAPWYTPSNAWSKCVLERMGIPVYFSADEGGAAVLEGETETFTDEELLAMCRGTLWLASDSAKELCDRGFSKYLGVTVKDWDERHPSCERAVGDEVNMQTQIGAKHLLPISDEVACESMLYHIEGGVKHVPLTPGVTRYHNELGGTVVCFAGTPNTPHVYGQAFAFLNETRKAHLVRLLQASGHLPVYYEGDEQVFLKTGLLPNGERIVALFNLGVDPIEEISLYTEKPYSHAEMLMADGTRASVSMRAEDGYTVFETPLFTMNPVILFLK